jgi:hypothetical protein
MCHFYSTDMHLYGTPATREQRKIKRELTFWHDFSFTAKQLLSPRTSSKYHASRGFSPNVRAPIVALVALTMVGNAPPFVSPAETARPPNRSLTGRVRDSGSLRN